jgi:hypothetical protein
LRLVAGGCFVLREKYCWLVADKPSEQAGNHQQLAVQFLPWLARNDLLFGWLVVAAGVDLL